MAFAGRKIASALAAMLLALTLSACDLLHAVTDESFRFRMTVEVDTPEGLRTGFSVYEVTAGNRTAILPEEADRTRSLRGEAVAVDLPDGRTLFAILKTNNWQRSDVGEAAMAALDPIYNNDWVENAARISSGDGIVSPAEIAPENYPMLVTFRDPKDPTSVRLVDPSNLAASFGEGASLESITVQVTDDPVTTGIEQRLGWLPSHVGSLVRRPRDLPIG